MPSPIAHSATGLFIALQFDHSGLDLGRTGRGIGFVLLAVALVNIPDLDFFLQLYVGERLHHTFSHSLVFTVGFSLLFGFLWYLRSGIYLMPFLLCLAVYSSHVLLDMLGGGPGVLLLWPFSYEYVRLPVQLFPPVHYSRGLFDSSHITFLLFESLYAAILLGPLRIAVNRLSRRQAIQG